MNLRIGAFLVKSSLLIPESSRSLSMLCKLMIIYVQIDLIAGSSSIFG